MDVYGDNANIIPEEIPELQEYMDEVLPGADSEQKEEEKIEDIMIDVDEFLAPVCKQK